MSENKKRGCILCGRALKGHLSYERRLCGLCDHDHQGTFILPSGRRWPVTTVIEYHMGRPVVEGEYDGILNRFEAEMDAEMDDDDVVADTTQHRGACDA